MSLSRREFLQALAAAARGRAFRWVPKAADDERFYDLPRFGGVSLLHFTDCHAAAAAGVLPRADTNLASRAA